MRVQLGAERVDQGAVLGVDRADAAEQLVVVCDLLEPFARIEQAVSQLHRNAPAQSVG